MDTGSEVSSIAVSRDGKWIVGGTKTGEVPVWNADSSEKVSEFRGHNAWVYSVDISPDATRMASGSDDRTVRVWSRSTGEQLLDPLKHDHYVVTVKFSPNKQFIATATYNRESVWVYDSRDGRLLFDSPIKVSSPSNQSLAWVSDSKQLFALSLYGKIHCLDVPTGRIHSAWAIHTNDKPRCTTLGNMARSSQPPPIHLSHSGTLLRTSKLALPFTTQIKSSTWPSRRTTTLPSGEAKVILQKLLNILPSSYFDHVGVF